MLLNSGSTRNYLSADQVQKLNLTEKDDIEITTEFGNNSVKKAI